MLKRALLLALLFTASAAFAQPAQQEVTIKLTQDKLNVLAQALEALPYKVAAPLIVDLQQQIKAQMPPPPEKPPESAAKP